MEKEIEELTLLLLYLGSWKEKPRGVSEPLYRSWKTFRFEVLDKLREQGLITGSRTSKSAFLTEEGTKRAEELKKKYNIN